MPDIKADYGAKGDGQLVTAVLTISSGSPNLSSTTNLWVVGDVGKIIAIEGAGTVSGPNPLGALLSKINSVTDGQHIVLNDNAITTLSSATKQVEWGTEDNTAFINFKNAYQGQSGVILTVPAGRYCFGISSGSVGFGFGVTGLTVQGTGDPVLTDMLGVGNGVFLGGCLSAIIDDGAHLARTQTIGAGSTVLTLLNISDASLFTVNTWALMTGFDVQGFGYPPNAQFYEYVFITSIHTGSGSDPSTITIQSPLINTYKSTWPVWTAGSVGSAALYQIQSGWDCTHSYNDIILVSTPTLTNSLGRSITFNGGSAPVFGPNPSISKDVVLNNYSIINTNWELDKLIDKVTLNNCTLKGLSGFSNPSPNIITLNSTTITTSPNFGGKKVIVNSSSIPGGLHLGPGSYGVNTKVNISGSSIASLDSFGGTKETDLSGVGAYTMSGGVIQRVKSAGSGSPPQWAVPGGWCYFGGYFNATSSFQVIDVTTDGTNIFIQTNLSGGFPTQYIPGGTTHTISAQTCPGASFAFSNNTGDQASGLSNSIPTIRPYCSWWRKTYTGNFQSINQSTITVFGKVISVSFNVIVPFTGTGALAVNLSGPFVLNSSGHAVVWNPSVDLTVAGERVIKLSGVTGSVGLDSGLTLPDATLTWLVDNQMMPGLSADIGGQSPSTYPTVVITVITDQGIPIDTGVSMMGSMCF